MVREIWGNNCKENENLKILRILEKNVEEMSHKFWRDFHKIVIINVEKF